MKHLTIITPLILALVSCSSDVQIEFEEIDSGQEVPKIPVVFCEGAEYGTPLVDQNTGDCRYIICDGSGLPISIPNNLDVYDDGNDCTIDFCENGFIRTENRPFENPCKLDEVNYGFCNEGSCVECMPGYYLYCYSGPTETIGVGICHSGYRECIDGRWSECLDEQKPRPNDFCFNHLDDNCNGIINDDCNDVCSELNIPTNYCGGIKSCTHCSLFNQCHEQFQNWIVDQNDYNRYMLQHCLFCEACDVVCSQVNFSCDSFPY